jgi:hypothetical protein
MVLHETPLVVTDKEFEHKLFLAKRGYADDLDVLVHDKDVAVRVHVAKHGRPQDLTLLKDDKSQSVRRVVNRQLRKLQQKLDSK